MRFIMKKAVLLLCFSLPALAMEQQCSLRSIVRHENEPLVEQIIHAGQAQSYEEITKILKTITSVKELKKLIVLQIDLALALVERVKFDIGYEDSHANHLYPHQNILIAPANVLKAQWNYILYNQKSLIKTFTKLESLIFPLSVIRNFVADFSLIKEIPMKSPAKIKEVVEDNFKELFKLLCLFAKATPSAFQWDEKFLLAAASNLLEDVKKMRKDPEIVRFIYIDFRGKDNKTALMYAVESGNAPLVTLLLDEGADVEAKSFDGRTALARAFENKNYEIMKMLLEADADAQFIKEYKNLESTPENIKKLLQQHGIHLETSDFPIH